MTLCTRITKHDTAAHAYRITAAQIDTKGLLLSLTPAPNPILLRAHLHFQVS